MAEQKGWILARINGSHHGFTKEGRIERVVIPIQGNRILKIGSVKSSRILVRLLSLKGIQGIELARLCGAFENEH